MTLINTCLKKLGHLCSRFQEENIHKQAKSGDLHHANINTYVRYSDE